VSDGDLILGIDLGTTSLKAAAIDAGGRVVASFAEAYPTHRPGGGAVEQDPDDWLRLIDRAVERIAAGGRAERIAGIGLCSQVNTHVFLGRDGRPLRRAITWQDGRAGAAAARLDARVDETTKREWWGAPMPIDASNVLSRMAWIAETDPETWERTRHVMLPKDLALLHLTGEAATDPLSNIGLTGPDLLYVAEALALVPGAAERVAPLVPVTTVAGHVRKGPLRGRPVVTGTMDAWAGLVGTGAAREGATVWLSGTSEVLGIAAARVHPTPGVVVFASSDGIRLHAAPTQSGGDALRWLAEAQGCAVEALTPAPASDATPLFLPQLEGERAPLWDASLRGAFLGLTRRTGAGDLTRAVMEGVALSARHALEALQASSGVASGPVTCGGGGFRSRAWTQIRADLLGVPLLPLDGVEPGVLGAATLAAVGLGRHADLAAAVAALSRLADPVRPDPDAARRAGDLFALYLDAIAANADLGRRIGALRR
jgi:xylulokinase